jgi:hypothetical protein
MSDCSNPEIRDLLPDLLHDRLDARTRARVVAHVDGCADCRSELELLRSLRGSLERGTPRVDLDRIVTALPAPSSVRAPQHGRVWRVLHDWRIAAAVTFIVAGGTSVVVIRNARDGAIDSSSTPLTRQLTRVASETTTHADSPAAIASVSREPGSRGASQSAPNRSQPTAAPPANSRGGAPAVASRDEQGPGLGNSRIGDLNERQLKSLLNEIDRMEATPITDPEPVVLRVGQKTASPTGL